MYTEIIQFFPILSQVGSLIIQTLTILIIIKNLKTKKQEINSIFLISILIIVSLLCLVTLGSFFVDSLVVYAPGILFISAILIALISFLCSLAEKSESLEIPEEKEPTLESLEEVVYTNTQDYLSIGLNYFQTVADSLQQDIKIELTYDTINQTLIEQTNASGGVIFMLDDFEDLITAKSFIGKFPPPYMLPDNLPHKPLRVETNFKYIQFNLGESIFGDVAINGKPILIKDGTKDNRIYINGPEDFLKPGSYMIVPVLAQDRIIGVLGLARLPELTPFTETDLAAVTKLSTLSGSAINTMFAVQEFLEKADLEREAGIASRIQTMLHPKKLPNLPSVGFGSFFNSAKGVCGDYYDIIMARRDRIGIIIADVAGKGIQSTIVMSMLRSILHLVTNTTKDASTILDWVNKGITGNVDMDHYASLSYLSYSPIDHSLEFANAGHQSMLILRGKTNEIETVKQKTDPIGIERSTIYSNLKLTVDKGDIIILYTDGLIEALNKEGKQYGLSSLSQVILNKSSLSAKEIANEVKQNVQTFVGNASLHDDQTLVVMKIKE